MITFKAKTATGEIINSALSPFTFPAGEAHLKREEQRSLEPTEIAIIQPSADSIHDDLFQLAMWNSAILGDNWEENNEDRTPQPIRVLILPYVPGARADRGTPYGLGVYAKFINNLDLEQVIVFDPHSPITEAELHRVTAVYPNEFFSQHYIKSEMLDYTGIIAPDKGAATRAGAVAEALGLPLYTAEKTRDFESGKLTGFKIDGLPQSTDEDDEFFLIVDDICDGGGTFLGLEAAAGLPFGKIDLYVSHGVFSKNALYNLKQRFEYIYTTNSYNPARGLNDHGDFGDPEAVDVYERFDVIRLLLSKIN